MKKSFVLLVVLLFTFMAFFSGCGKKDVSEQGSSKEVDATLTAVAMVDTGTLDPTVEAACDPLIAGSLYDTLVKFNKDYKVVPRLADTWTEAEDHMSITFHINDKATFHDGSKVTAKDVAYSINKKLATAGGTAVTLYIPNKVEVVDDSHVKISKAYVDEKLLELLSSIFYVVPEALASNADAFSKNPVGSGPYKFISIGSDGTVKMVANENYLLGAPDIKELTVKSPIDPSTAVIALQTGEIDLYQGIPTSNYSQISNDKKLVLKKEGGFTGRVVVLGGKLFDNVKLREAVYRVINSQNAVVVGAENDGIITNTILPAAMAPDSAEALKIKDRYNLKLAFDLIKESGYDLTKPIELPITAQYALDAQSIQADLKNIGLTLKIEQMDYNTWVSKLMTGGCPVIISDYGGPYASAYDVLHYFTTEGDIFEIYNAQSPELDAIMEKVAKDTDLSVRKQDITNALPILIALHKIVPLYEKNLNVAFSSRFDADTITGTAVSAINIGDIKLKK